MTAPLTAAARGVLLREEFHHWTEVCDLPRERAIRDLCRAYGIQRDSLIKTLRRNERTAA